MKPSDRDLNCECEVNVPYTGPFVIRLLESVVSKFATSEISLF